MNLSEYVGTEHINTLTKIDIHSDVYSIYIHIFAHVSSEGWFEEGGAIVTRASGG